MTHNPVHFLQRFHLNHSHLELEIAELRLITNRPEILPFLDEGNVAWTIVHTPGVIHKYTFHTNAWEITDHFPSSQLVDPPIPYFLPPTTPSPGFQAVPELHINYYTSFLDHASNSRQILLQDSDLESTDTDTTLPELKSPTRHPPVGNKPITDLHTKVNGATATKNFAIVATDPTPRRRLHTLLCGHREISTFLGAIDLFIAEYPKYCDTLAILSLVFTLEFHTAPHEWCLFSC